MNRDPDALSPVLTDGARAELASSARFAVDLVDFIESKLDAHLEAWSNISPIRHVTTTSQIVEGLDAIALPHITTEMTSHALDWLVELPVQRHWSNDEAAAARLHPSRFKTLAQMGRLDEENDTLQDFRKLCKQVNPRDGLLHDTPMSSLPLATMIWLDTLAHLSARGWDVSAHKNRFTRAYQVLNGEYAHWLSPPETAKTKSNSPRGNGSGKPKPNSAARLNDDADASYALDLLMCSQTLTHQHPAVSGGKTKLLTALKNRKRNDWRNYDALYCAIQLCRHFRNDPQIQHSAIELVNELCATFESNQFQEQALPLSALSLRVLGALYGDLLSARIHHDQWAYQRAQERQAKQIQAQEHHAKLSRIVRDTFQIRVGDEESLSNPHAENQVVRVRFGFDSPAVDDREQSPHAADNSLRIILKQGTAASLQRAIDAYRALPGGIQMYFAEHAPTLPLEQNLNSQPAYLVMRDLAGMELLADIAARHDCVPLDDDSTRATIQAARQVALAFQALHHEPKAASGTTNHLERLYLIPLSASIDTVCDNYFPALRAFVEDGFDTADNHYKRLPFYLNELRKHETFLRPSKLGRIHGDAHSRNIMLDRTRQRVKFIDVEYFASDQDYLMDYALLIEDIAFYQYLARRQNTQRLLPEQITSILSGKETQSRNAIHYPPFPIHSDAASLFQRTLLMQLDSFAKALQDTNWKTRLWLAVAKSLLMLLERQTRSKRLINTERDPFNRVLVIYAEAVRLLDEIITSNARWQGLPELPFGGQRIALREPDDRDIARHVLQLFEEITGVVRRAHPEVPPWVQFFVRDRDKPFAEFHNLSKDRPLELVLFAPAERLQDPERVITTRNSDGGLVVPKSRLTNYDAVRTLIQSAYQNALHSGNA